VQLTCCGAVRGGGVTAKLHPDSALCSRFTHRLSLHNFYVLSDTLFGWWLLSDEQSDLYYMFVYARLAILSMPDE
jgi:hypothetical protein